MENSEYTYNGRPWTQALTVPDENSFFHSVFGSNDDEVYYDKHAKVKRFHWAAFLAYFQNETMPTALVETLKKCLLAHEEYKHVSLEDKEQFEKYVSGIVATETSVALEEIPILATLQNVKITVLSDKKGESVIVIEPNFELLGNYKIHLDKRREVLVCLEEQTFSRLEPVIKELGTGPKQDATSLFLDILNQSRSSDEQGPFVMAKLFDVVIETMRTNFIQNNNPYEHPDRNEELSIQFDRCLVYLRTLAIRHIFDNQFELFLSIQEPDESVKENVMNLGVIQKLGSKYHFTNNVMAEYFVGQSLAKELELQNQNVLFHKFFFEEIFCKKEYTMIRCFLNHSLKGSVDSIPTNIFQNYLTYKAEGEPENRPQLIFVLSCEGSVESLRLLLKCLDFQIVRDKVVSVRDLPEELRGNSLRELQFLLQRGGLNIMGEGNRTPLHSAAATNQVEMIKYLVEQGADINCKDKMGGTPLHIASTKKLSGVKTLVELGADVNVTDNRSQTPLHCAAESNVVDIVKFLVEHGANVNVLDENDFAPLHSAVLLGRWESARLLAELGADFNAPGSNADELLNLYASRGQLDLVRFLAKLGANLNGFDQLGDTSITLAISRGHLDTFKCLVEVGADVTQRNRAGLTPLHLSTMYNRLDFVRHLVEHGADVQAKERAGLTALHAAAARGYLDLVKYFVEVNADLNITSNDGQTALHYAAKFKHRDVVKFLLESGADQSKRNNEGQTALQVAESSGETELVRLFSELGCE